jgi:hypothetical protein
MLGDEMVLAVHPADRAGGLASIAFNHLLPCRFRPAFMRPGSTRKDRVGIHGRTGLRVSHLPALTD